MQLILSSLRANRVSRSDSASAKATTLSIDFCNSITTSDTRKVPHVVPGTEATRQSRCRFEFAHINICRIINRDPIALAILLKQLLQRFNHRRITGLTFVGHV